VRYQDLRHFAASTMLSAGVPVVLVAEVLGHSAAILLSTYAHVLAYDHDRARQAIEQAFADSARTEAAV
jgi:site-specific recombinase XerD